MKRLHVLPVVIVIALFCEYASASEFLIAKGRVRRLRGSSAEAVPHRKLLQSYSNFDSASWASELTTTDSQSYQWDGQFADAQESKPILPQLITLDPEPQEQQGSSGDEDDDDQYEERPIFHRINLTENDKIVGDPTPLLKFAGSNMAGKQQDAEVKFIDSFDH